MSFAKRVKEEIIHRREEDPCCQLAEMAAIFRLLGRITFAEGAMLGLRLSTENGGLARKIFGESKERFAVDAHLAVMRRQKLRKSNIYVVDLQQAPAGQAATIFQLTGCDLPGAQWGRFVRRNFRKPLFCAKAFLRGAFLAAGSVNEPGKGYHLEIICGSEIVAHTLVSFMRPLGISGKISLRKDEHVVYLKESDAIADFLSGVGAHVALMDFEEFRVIKSMKNNVNRVVNCETANLNKVVDAAARQMEAIAKIESSIGFAALSPDLSQVAEKRMDYPELSLKELGEILTPKLGKSGVNYRLRKIIQIADKLS